MVYTGLPEPTSIYPAEGYPDPGDLLASPYRPHSAKPDTEQEE